MAQRVFRGAAKRTEGERVARRRVVWSWRALGCVFVYGVCIGESVIEYFKQE